MSETLRPGPEVLNPEKKQQVVFISGATGTNDGMRTIKGALHEKYGVDNVSVYNSVLFGDRPSPERFQKMGADLKEKITKGPTTILAHSFAAAETLEAFDEIEKTDPGFFDKKENMENIQLVLISPAGFFENWRQGLKYGAKYIKLGVQEAGMLKGWTLPGKGSILHGVVSAGIIPPEGLDRDQLVQGVRKVSGDVSQSSQGAREVDFQPDRDYLPYLSDDERAQLQEVDSRFAEATKEDTPTLLRRLAARKALRQRGRITRGVVENTFSNTYSDDFEDPARTNETFGKDKVASQRSVRLMWDTFIKGRILGKMTERQNAGMKINFVVPEQDTMMTVGDARNFLLGNEDRLVVAPLSTHRGPWAPQPQILVEMAKAFEHQFEQT